MNYLKTNSPSYMVQCSFSIATELLLLQVLCSYSITMLAAYMASYLVKLLKQR